MKLLKTILVLALLPPNANAASRVFPQNFKWCVATSAHQIEGANTNSDWWDFEQLPGKIKNGDHSGSACDHWNRLAEDTALLSDLHVTEYRFGIEWAKIEPTPGLYDKAAIEHYRQELKLLHARGIEPMVTLQHFTLPRWVRAQGGWEWSETPARFARFAELVIKQIGPEVHDWITINEPMVTLLSGYVAGASPPGKTGDLKSLVAPLLGLMHAHAEAYRALHGAAIVPIRVGLAHHMRIFDPATDWNPADALVASKLDEAFNWALPTALETGQLSIHIPLAIDIDQKVDWAKGTQDFFGLNYYTRDMVAFDVGGTGFKLGVPDGAELNDVGWEIYPEGFYRILKATAEHYPGKSIFITENGTADARDAKRPAFLDSHLAQVARAISEGMKIEGYCHWSLYDNFEWSLGFTPRFGLYEIDYRTLERKPRASARRFAEIAISNSL